MTPSKTLKWQNQEIDQLFDQQPLTHKTVNNACIYTENNPEPVKSGPYVCFDGFILILKFFVSAQFFRILKVLAHQKVPNKEESIKKIKKPCFQTSLALNI